MSKVEKISVALSSELLMAVNAAVESGEYASVSEVIREALRGWKISELRKQAEIEWLRQTWKEGIDSGRPRPLDFEEIKRRGRERLARERPLI